MRSSQTEPDLVASSNPGIREASDERARLASIIESSDDAIVSKDLNGTILTWNRGAAAIYGYTAEEVIGQSINLLVGPDRAGEEESILRKIRAGQRVQHFETVRINKSGIPVHVSVTVSPILGETGVIGASHVAREISERKRLEAANAQLAAIVASSEDAIISKDLNGVIRTWNASAERLYGYSAAEAIGRNMRFLQPPGKEGEEEEILEKTRRGERVNHFETVRKKQDGTVLHVSLTISPIRDRGGTVIGVSHVARDITKRKELEDQLRQTQRLESLGVLAGGIAHDFNNLLTGILGNATLAMELLPENCGSLIPVLDDVVAASERAAHLTRQLLAYAGKGRFMVEPLDLTVMVHGISQLVRSSIPANANLRLELADGLPCIEGDASQVQQVVMNLVINAAEAIPGDRAGNVLVTTSLQDVDETYIRQTFAPEEVTPGRYICLEVRDNGVGMDDAIRARIFDPFFTTKFTGRGLGLAAVLGIVRGHKGALRVYSIPGSGTTFKVLFPAMEGASPVSSSLRTKIETMDNRGRTILIIDDESTVRRTARASLERRGYEVVLAEDGTEGIEVFRAFHENIAAVLLDLTMPGMNGEQVLGHLKEIRPDVKVILSSGFNEVEVIQRFAGKGLSGFIQKPYTSTALAAAIAQTHETK